MSDDSEGLEIYKPSHNFAFLEIIFYLCSLRVAYLLSYFSTSEIVVGNLTLNRFFFIFFICHQYSDYVITIKLWFPIMILS